MNPNGYKSILEALDSVPGGSVIEPQPRAGEDLAYVTSTFTCAPAYVLSALHSAGLLLGTYTERERTMGTFYDPDEPRPPKLMFLFAENGKLTFEDTVVTKRGQGSLTFR